MSRYLSGPLFVAFCVVACGGGTEDSNPNPSGGTSAAAGTSAAGQSTGGTASGGAAGAGGGVTTAGAGGSVTTAGAGGSVTTAGTSAGGTVSNGGSGGSSGGAGGRGGAGGTTSVDPRCPPKAPSGMCTTEQADALCDYDLGTGCLCQSPNPTAFCTKVDPTCPGGDRAGAPPPDGAAGSTSKVALPPKRACRCSGGNWQCSP
jgi:hypothetical protein